MPKRLSEIDFIKGIGILLVMIGHSGISGFPRVWIYGFHMPLFFLVSGLFFKRKTMHDFLVVNTKRLLVPWCIFAVILVLSTLVFSLITGGSLRNDVICQLNPFDESSRCLFLSIWFFICLFIVRFVFNLIAVIRNKCLQVGITLFGGVIGLILQGYFNLPFFIDSAFTMIPFYGLGYWISPFIVKRKLDINNVWYLVLGASGIVIYSLLCYKVNPVVDVKTNSFPVVAWPLALIAICFMYAFSAVFSRVRGMSLFPYLGRKSIYLLGLHRPLYLFLIPVIYGLPCSIFLKGPLLIIATIVLSLVGATILHKFFPNCFGE